jgi:ParB family chromosome partitioning protein
MSNVKPRPSRLGRGLSSLMAQPVRVTMPVAPAPNADQVNNPSTSADAAPVPMQADATTTPDAGIAAADPAPAAAGAGLHMLPVSSIRPNPHQPRQRFDPAGLESLAASIRSEGVMQPIIVRAVTNGQNGDHAYELVAGERRWRAAQLASLTEVPAIVRPLDDRQLAEWALVENIQREDLNPIERAEAFRSLTERFSLSHGEVAERVGLDRSTITNLLRLLDLEQSVRDLIRDGLLSMGQARALAGLADPAMQKLLGQRIVAEGMSVRAVEAAVKKAAALGSGGAVAAEPPPPAIRRASHLTDLEQQIARQLGSRVRIRPGRKKGAGAITIEFYSLDQFDALLNKLGVTAE